MSVRVLRVGSLPQGAESQSHWRNYNPDAPAAAQPRAVENGVRAPPAPAGPGLSRSSRAAGRSSGGRRRSREVARGPAGRDARRLGGRGAGRPLRVLIRAASGRAKSERAAWSESRRAERSSIRNPAPAPPASNTAPEPRSPAPAPRPRPPSALLSAPLPPVRPSAK